MTKDKLLKHEIAKNTREIRNKNGKKVAEIDYVNNVVIIGKESHKTLIYFEKSGIKKIENI